MVKKKQEAMIGHLEQAGGTFVSFFAYHTNVQISNGGEERSHGDSSQD